MSAYPRGGVKKKAPIEYALRDEEGRVRLRVSVPYLVGGLRNLRVFVIRGKTERVHCVATQKMENYHDGEVLARTLVALCDVWAMQNGVDYVLDNPERIDTLRCNPKRAKPAGPSYAGISTSGATDVLGKTDA